MTIGVARLMVALLVLGALFVMSRGVRAAPPDDVLLARGRTEPVVAVNAVKPSIVVASSNTNYSVPVGGTFPTGYFFSGDGGRTFGSGTAPMVSPYTTGADTTIAVARDGTVFYSYLGETPSFCSNGGGAIVVTHSIDNGRSYRTPVLADVNPNDDKPNMAVESVPGGPSHIFLTWTRWLSNPARSEVLFARSLDGGVKFSRPVRLWSSRLANFGTVPLIGAGGRLWVFWSVSPNEEQRGPSPSGIFVMASRDDGAHFGTRVAVSGTFPSVPDLVQPGALRVLTMPATAIDLHGVIYVAWAQTARKLPAGRVDADIVLSRSADGGRVWSRPDRVNDARSGARFMPSLAVMNDGSLGVAFYDQRTGPRNLGVEAARVRFSPAFHASRNVPVSGGSSPIGDITYVAPGSTCFAPGRFFGDYISDAALKHELAVVWADTQLHVPGETEVWFARIELPATPR